MVRFFVSGAELQSDVLTLTDENAQHAKVLRLRVGDEVCACDGEGKEALCTVTEAGGGQYTLTVDSRSDARTEAKVRVRIYMAFPKADKLEHVIQKATELGAYEIVAFPTARCVSRPEEKQLAKKLERWKKIAQSAAEQSGRGRIPQVRLLASYKLALEEAAKDDVAILFYENEDGRTLSQALAAKPGFETISLMTGPEGGLEEKEVAQARETGLEVCTLGTRILRCETAPLCALSAVMFAAGEF